MGSARPPEIFSSSESEDEEVDFWSVIRSEGRAQAPQSLPKPKGSQFAGGSKITFEAGGGLPNTEVTTKQPVPKNTEDGLRNTMAAQMSGPSQGAGGERRVGFMAARPAPAPPKVHRDIQPEGASEPGGPSPVMSRRLQPSAPYVPGGRLRNYAHPFKKEGRAKMGPLIKESSNFGSGRMNRGMMSAPSLPLTLPGSHVIDGDLLVSRASAEAESPASNRENSHFDNFDSTALDPSFDHTEMENLSPNPPAPEKRASSPGFLSSPFARNEVQGEVLEAEGSKRPIIPPRSSSTLGRLTHKLMGLRRSQSQNIEPLRPSPLTERNDESNSSSDIRKLPKRGESLGNFGHKPERMTANYDKTSTGQTAESKYIKGKGKIVHPHLAGHGPLEIIKTSASKATSIKVQDGAELVTTGESSKGRTVLSTLRKEPDITLNPDLSKPTKREDDGKNKPLPALVYHKRGLGDDATSASNGADAMVNETLCLHMSDNWDTPLRGAAIEAMWNNIPEETKRTLKHLDLDVFVPGVTSEPKHGDVPHSFALTPLSGFRNLRSLRVHMMLDSYQEHIWTAAWCMLNLEELTMEMILPPEVDALENGVWKSIDQNWSITENRYVNLYHGNKNGCLHESIGCGEYLDYVSVLKGKLNAQRQGFAMGARNKLSLRKLSLSGFAVHGKPIVEFFDPTKFKEIRFISKCVDGGFSLAGTQFSGVIVTSPAAEAHHMTVSRIPPGTVRSIVLRGGKEVKGRELPKQIEENETPVAQAVVQQAAQASGQETPEPSPGTAPETPKAKKVAKKAVGKK